mmetsp:Transcript_14059/g.20783  ORF Transcript_14059/g.20783 Transcript_14059/m.20783 type:complete len:166 (-) Transcript_14059:8-505(-)
MGEAPEVLAAREKLKNRFGAGAARVGGRGSVRRKQKAAHKSSANDDKKLQSCLKRLGVNQVSSVSEVQMFKDDDTCMVFGPGVKVQVNIAANTYVISGPSETKPSSEVASSGFGGMDMAQLQAMMQQAQAAQAAAGGAEGGADGADDDDAVPDLVEDFEEVSESS